MFVSHVFVSVFAALCVLNHAPQKWFGTCNPDTPCYKVFQIIPRIFPQDRH
jgi:hypothetical protein